MAGFADTWAKVQQHSGATFRTVTGKEFRYRAHDTGVDMLTTNQTLPRRDFEEAVARMPVAGPGALQDLRGPSYSTRSSMTRECDSPGSPSDAADVFAAHLHRLSALP